MTLYIGKIKSSKKKKIKLQPKAEQGTKSAAQGEVLSIESKVLIQFSALHKEK